MSDSVFKTGLVTVSICLIAGASFAAPGDPAGVVAATQGTISRILYSAPQQERARGIGKDIATGARIFLGDEIKTGPQSRMQILLLDETAFTIGPDSNLTIDEFVYDPTTSKGKVAARITKGYFRFISGKISAENPENVTITLPVASIGIRGTTVYGFVDGNNALIGLGGPGRESSHQRRGIMVITSGKTSQTVYKAGFGVSIAGLGNIGEPLRFNTLAQTIQNALMPRLPTTARSSPPGVARDVVDQSGINKDAALVAAQTETRNEKTVSTSNTLTVDASQTTSTIQSVLNSPVTTVGQALAVNTGQITGTGTFDLYAVTGTGSGTNTLTLTVDFGARTITNTSTYNATLGGDPLVGTNTFVASYAGQNPSSALSASGTAVFPTPYGPLTSTRTTTFQNTPDGIARLAITSVENTRNGSTIRASGTLKLSPP